MSESYPRKVSWPFVLAGLLLFGVALWPPSEWPKAVRHVYVDWIATHVVKRAATTHAQQPSSEDTAKKKRIPRVTIGFTPSPSRLPSNEGPLPQVNSVDPVIEKVASSAAPTFLAEEIGAELGSGTPSVSNRGADVLEPSPAKAAAGAYVWQPPKDWVPTLIEPFSASTTDTQLAQSHRSVLKVPEASSTTTQSIGLTPTPSLIAGPVAKHESRIPRVRTDRTELPYGVSASESAKQVQVPLPSELEQPNEPAPIKAEPEIALPEQTESELVTPAKIANASDATTDKWGSSARMLRLLELGSDTPHLNEWSRQLRLRLRHLRSQEFSGSDSQQLSLARIQELATYPVEISGWSPAEQQTYWRIRHAVMRNASVWSPLLKRATNEAEQFDDAMQQLESTSSRLAQRLAIQDETKLWSTYLELDRLTFSDERTVAGRRAERTLSLLLNSNLDPTQRAFLSSPVFRTLEADLRAAVSASIASSDVVQALISYEDETSTSNARAALATLQRFGTGPNNNQYDPALDAIDTAYRNANLRVAVSEELINRFVPAMHQYAERVDDTILGAAVRGNNSTLTNLSIQLIPDYQSIRLGLFASGSVNSNTASRKGPVVVYNHGKSQFAAGKELMVRPDGIFYKKTETRATTGNRLVGMRTDLDGIPFIGSIVRSIARRQHDEQRPFMRREVVARVERSAKKKMDVEVQRRLANVEGRVQTRVVEPLRKLQLDPRAMEMRTTEDRAILRTRLAGPLQFGAHTPRPQARADSKMSFQIHQSAANNMIEQLNLKGRRMTLGELTNELSNRFGTKIDVPEKRRDCIVQFAKNNPLEFEFEQGQIKLTIHFAELDNGTDSWKDFSVCGYYRADIKQLDVELVRNGSIELITEPLKLRDQIALRSIFTKVFAANSKLGILRQAIQQQPNLRSLVVTQFAIRDGWMALSLGENGPTARLAERSTAKRR